MDQKKFVPLTSGQESDLRELGHNPARFINEMRDGVPCLVLVPPGLAAQEGRMVADKWLSLLTDGAPNEKAE